MKFAKGGLVIESNNPVCDSLYLKQGWTPVIDEPKINEVVQTTEEVKNEQPVKEVQIELPLDSKPLTEEKPTVKATTQPKKSNTTATKRK